MDEMSNNKEFIEPLIVDESIFYEENDEQIHIKLLVNILVLMIQKSGAG